MSTPPPILDSIKSDLGITGTENDAFITRRIAAAWAWMERYTSRELCVPPAGFIDDWRRIAQAGPVPPLPPSWDHQPRATVFLRHFPVVKIDAVDLDGTAGVAADVMFNPKTGKLFSLRGQVESEDLSNQLWRTKITYTAGWAEVPADLYEIVLGAVQAAWIAKSTGGALGVPGTVTGINVVDVGSVEMAQGNAFVQAATKGSGASDPLLGPYVNMLDLYIDHRSRIGHAMVPVTEPVPVVPRQAVSAMP
jgi:hypothetical protein